MYIQLCLVANGKATSILVLITRLTVVDIGICHLCGVNCQYIITLIEWHSSYQVVLFENLK